MLVRLRLYGRGCSTQGWASRILVLVCLLGAPGILLASDVAASPYLQRQEFRDYLQDVERRHGFAPGALETWFADLVPRQAVLDAMARPPEKALTWGEYRAIFIKPERIELGRRFLSQHAEAFARAERQFGVPATTVAAVIGVETRFGEVTGRHPVLAALTTLGFDYPRRAKFFRGELEQFLLLAREQGLDPVAVQGSYTGAMGLGQFMPSSYRHYAIDFDGDQRADLMGSPADAIGSVANYLARHGWKAGAPVSWRVHPAQPPASEWLPARQKPAHTLAQLRTLGIDTRDLPSKSAARLIRLQGGEGPEYWLTLHNFFVITRYNQSDLYAMAVLHLGEALQTP